MKYQNYFSEKLKKIKLDQLYRFLIPMENNAGPEITIKKRKYISFSSNNYLGLADYNKIKTSAIYFIRKYGVGTAASRLVCGNNPVHEMLEKKIAEFKKTEAALVFSSGYMANLGVISSIMDEGDAIFSDELNHASLVDACRFSKAKVFIYPHNSVNVLKNWLNKKNNFKKKLIVTETVFSMNGDISPLPEIAELARKHNCLLMVDEAHAIGVFGENGRGLAEHFKMEKNIDISMGTLSKSIGAFGGFIASDKLLIELLKNKARSFIYTTALPAGIAASAISAIEVMKNEPDRKKQLWSNLTYLKEQLINAGLDILNSESQIIPIVIGDNKKALSLSRYLFDNGLFVPAMRPPTVPKGTSRLRISVTALHKKRHIDLLLDILLRGIKK